MRAKELMLELALSQVFLGLDENPTDLTPTIDKTHKNKSKDNWRDIIQKYLDTPITMKAYIQHVFKGSKTSRNAKNKKEEDTYLKLLSKESCASCKPSPRCSQLRETMGGIKLQHHILL
jgi:predicted nucleotidyltransferase